MKASMCFLHLLDFMMEMCLPCKSQTIPVKVCSSWFCSIHNVWWLTEKAYVYSDEADSLDSRRGFFRDASDSSAGLTLISWADVIAILGGWKRSSLPNSYLWRKARVPHHLESSLDESMRQCRPCLETFRGTQRVLDLRIPKTSSHEVLNSVALSTP